MRGICHPLSLIGLFCSLASVARADERRLSGELATGVLVIGEGMTPYEGGVSLDLGLSYLIDDHFLARGAVGYAPLVDRHSPESFVRVRLEGALRLKLGRVFVPLLGVGGSFWNRSPSLHGLLGLGFVVAPHWQLGVDIRSGPFWDHEEEDRHHKLTPFGEGQFRVSWSFR